MPAETKELANLKWWTPRELASHYRVSLATITRHLHEVNQPGDSVPAGKIPAVRIGRQLRIHEDTVKAKEAAAVAAHAQAKEVSNRKQRRFSRSPVDLIGNV